LKDDLNTNIHGKNLLVHELYSGMRAIKNNSLLKTS